jgi:hypothetical protein
MSGCQNNMNPKYTSMVMDLPLHFTNKSGSLTEQYEYELTVSYIHMNNNKIM